MIPVPELVQIIAEISAGDGGKQQYNIRIVIKIQKSEDKMKSSKLFSL